MKKSKSLMVASRREIRRAMVERALWVADRAAAERTEYCDNPLRGALEVPNELVATINSLLARNIKTLR